jgi:hypothetical protein
MKKSNKKSLIFIRCRYCAKVFKGKSDQITQNWYNHLTACEKKYENKSKKNHHVTIRLINEIFC